MNILNKKEKIYYFLKERKTLSKILLKLLIDLILYNLATLISVLLRFDFILNKTFVHIDDSIGFIENSIFLILNILFNLPFHSYEFTSLKELTDIFLSILLTKLINYPIMYILIKGKNFSRGVYLISLLLSLLFLVGFRLIFRFINEIKIKNYKDINRRIKNVLIFGTGILGEKILREIILNPQLGYNIVGFIDEDHTRIGLKIHGKPILGTINDVPKLVDMYKIEIIINSNSLKTSDNLKKLINITSKINVQLKTVPPMWEIISGKINIDDIRNVELEDLLPRKSIKINNDLIESYIKNKIILITGAGGSIGSELTRQIIKFKPKKIILLGRGENRIFDIERELKEKINFHNFDSVICDIRNREKIFWLFEKYKPQIIFHTAAHKHVPLMEKNLDEAILNNVFGTKNLIDASINYFIERFINISTDKAVNPINVMGVSKRLVEIMIKIYSDKYKNIIFTNVRFGNVLGSKGSVSEIFKEQIQENGLITITNPDMERYFMLSSEAVELVIYAAGISNGGETFILKMGEPVNILEFAKSFVNLSGKELGKDVRIKIIGNRGGEKLKEQLWSEKEKVTLTNNPYILKIEENYANLNEEIFFEKLEILKDYCYKFDYKKINEILRELVPEYKIVYNY